MRNYLFSIATHLVLLLLLLGLSFTTIKNKPEQEVKQVILVDFSQQKTIKETAPTTKRPAKKAQKQRSAAPSPQKASKAESKATKTPKKALRTSQKPAETSKVLDEKSSVVKKVIPRNDPQPTKEELAKAEREKKKAEKRSHFSSLLSKAKNKTAADTDQPETREEVSGVKTSTSSSSSNNKNIQGVLGNRKVLKSPSITDKSQKKGRVVVKICVGSDGKVLSSKYTMMGSTTSDSYLIGLAEKGAKQYLFSTSSNPKECGNVVIEFQLK